MDYHKLPLSFGMELVMNPNAFDTYSAMTKAQKKEVLNKARQARSQQDMRNIVNGITGQ